MTNPNSEMFKAALEKLFRDAEKEGKSEIIIRAGDLHKSVGGYSGNNNHRMSVCCSAMKTARQKAKGDRILEQPKSGQGANLYIKYKLPRD